LSLHSFTLEMVHHVFLIHWVDIVVVESIQLTLANHTVPSILSRNYISTSSIACKHSRCSSHKQCNIQVLTLVDRSNSLEVCKVNTHAIHCIEVDLTWIVSVDKVRPLSLYC
jgi:hypothetical protein